MRKNILSLSIAAMIGGIGFAGGASAAVLTTGATALDLQVTPGGTGHILVVPYYTAQNNNATLLNIVNTDAKNGKEVKIRFRGASNSDDVFDFTLFMSPSDMWSAKVSVPAGSTDGIPTLFTTDTSCTLPQSVNAPFMNAVSVPRIVPATLATAAQRANELREGYIEILNVADIPKALLNGQNSLGGTVTTNPLYSTILHAAPVGSAAAKPACDQTRLVALGHFDPATNVSVTPPGTAATIAAEKAASTVGLSNPSGGLFANTTVINTASTLTFTQEATGITAVTAVGGNIAGLGNLVHSPQNTVPLTAVGGSAAGPDAGAGVPIALSNINALTADALLRTKNTARASATVDITAAPVTALYQDLPDLSTPYTSAGGAAASLASPLAQTLSLTQALAVKAVMNEYGTVSGIGGTTDWTFSMPTRRYHVAMDYTWATAKGGTDGRVFTDLTGAAAANVAIKAASASRYFATDNTTVSGWQICVSGDALNGITTFDREEQTNGNAITISPGAAGTPVFCGETSVLSVNTGPNLPLPASTLGATVARQDFLAIGIEGWARVGTAGLTNDGNPVAADLANANGLPVLGASYMKASAGGQNYGLIANHRVVR